MLKQLKTKVVLWKYSSHYLWYSNRHCVLNFPTVLLVFVARKIQNVNDIIKKIRIAKISHLHPIKGENSSFNNLAGNATHASQWLFGILMKKKDNLITASDRKFCPIFNKNKLKWGFCLVEIRLNVYNWRAMPFISARQIFYTKHIC